MNAFGRRGPSGFGQGTAQGHAPGGRSVFGGARPGESAAPRAGQDSAPGFAQMPERLPPERIMAERRPVVRSFDPPATFAPDAMPVAPQAPAPAQAARPAPARSDAMGRLTERMNGPGEAPRAVETIEASIHRTKEQVLPRLLERPARRVLALRSRPAQAQAQAAAI